MVIGVESSWRINIRRYKIVAMVERGVSLFPGKPPGREV
jgi:hypothetical protein